MSGPGAKGAKQRVRVYQKGQATYPLGGIKRNGLVDVDTRLGKEALKVLIGFRIEAAQDIVDFQLFGKKGGHPKQIPTQREVAPFNIATQLQVIAPEAGEKWIGYIADYDPSEHGGNPFTTVLEVRPFTTNGNGFQEVPVAFTYQDPAGNEFTAGHYIVGTSILPGKDADPEPPPEHTPKPVVKKKPKKKAKTKAKTKAVKKKVARKPR
jgi:hypothetical protein